MRNANQSDRYAPGAKDNKDQHVRRVVLSAALAIAASGCFWRSGGEPRHEERHEVRPAEHREERREDRREDRREERKPERREEHRD